MSTLTIRLTNDIAERLEALARSRGLSVNGLIEEMSVQALAAWDAERRFGSMAAKGDIAQALSILERLDRQSAE
ncbi:ribbon-helix-helix domain-containing protein [Skermanella mucosa]|uniref:ribbon-helix-helix domain-containing protein n=1 Tax=Skermanella mucosa TaxID=1789672 RepID=UPI00192C9DF6|nr:CopG family transcriptional regulator [Skermanella mucosa]UEM20560.1 ribbon-helix-helix domain-containing protein [Skermanella mucosa]